MNILSKISAIGKIFRDEKSDKADVEHCVKSVRIRSFCGLYFLACRLSSPNIKSEWGNYGPEKTPKMQNFYAVEIIWEDVRS